MSFIKISTVMWKGRVSQDTSSLVQQFGESISYDWRLFPHDIAGSIAHARAQKNLGLLTEDEFLQIEKGLKEIDSAHARQSALTYAKPAAVV